jgi:hypothetical protein
LQSGNNRRALPAADEAKAIISVKQGVMRSAPSEQYDYVFRGQNRRALPVAEKAKAIIIGNLIYINN